MTQVVVTGAFDDIRSPHIRFLEEASQLGELTVLLWTDESVRAAERKPPNFPQEERLYLLQAVRHVGKAILAVERDDENWHPQFEEVKPDIWVVDSTQDTARKRAWCDQHHVHYHVLHDDDLRGFPERRTNEPTDTASRRRVVVTGCYDWFHSGHVRFFEEAAELGDLYVIVGNDANVRELKGEGHPFYPEEERRYMVQSVRHVKQTLVATGFGWLDAEAEIERVQPDYYVVNEDGDKPIKRGYCEKHGIEYRVLRRIPKPGLPPRNSTNLRGF